MKSIGGNITCKLMTRVTERTSIGTTNSSLVDHMELLGFLDLRGETTSRTDFSAKMFDGTHIFLCDYVDIEKSIRDVVFVDHKGREYDVMAIDNPMELDYHLEIYLRRVGD